MSLAVFFWHDSIISAIDYDMKDNGATQRRQLIKLRHQQWKYVYCMLYSYRSIIIMDTYLRLTVRLFSKSTVFLSRRRCDSTVKPHYRVVIIPYITIRHRSDTTWNVLKETLNPLKNIISLVCSLLRFHNFCPFTMYRYTYYVVMAIFICKLRIHIPSFKMISILSCCMDKNYSPSSTIYPFFVLRRSFNGICF